MTTRKLAGFVYADASNNGLKDGAEAGVAGVTVRLLDSGGNQIATTVTDSTGAYRVVEVQPSAYLDGIDTLGTCISVTVSNDIFSNVVIPAAGNLAGAGYNFGSCPSPPAQTAR